MFYTFETTNVCSSIQIIQYGVRLTGSLQDTPYLFDKD